MNSGSDNQIYPTLTEQLAVVIFTLNEEKNLPACLAAIPRGITTVIVDSGSTDDTENIALQAGLRVVKNRWPGFAAQRNFSLQQAGIQHEWVLFIDADEIYTPAIFSRLEQDLKSGASYDAAYISSHLVLDGTVLKYAPGYPVYHPRLVRRTKVSFLPNHAGHGETLASGVSAINIDIPYLHNFQSDGMLSWIQKHVSLARVEATSTSSGTTLKTFRARMAQSIRTSMLKAILRFVYHYILRGGFLDGRAGYKYSLMYFWFEVTKVLFKPND